MPSIPSFDIISVAVPDPKFFLCIPTSAAYAAVNLSRIKTILANDWIAFFVNGNTFFQ